MNCAESTCNNPGTYLYKDKKYCFPHYCAHRQYLGETPNDAPTPVSPDKKEEV